MAGLTDVVAPPPFSQTARAGSAMLTNANLLMERPNPIGGVQRIYRFPSGYGLSAINASMAHAYPYAWEIAVLKSVQDDGKHAGCCYDTPLTDDVEVFGTADEANEFIHRAAREIGGGSQ